jgi:ParB family transcriptional regulator, chromosome partitioning protein
MKVSSPLIDEITVPDGRRDLDPERVKGLAESMREIGLLHPIVVTYPDECTIQLVAGRHRLEAARSLGWSCIDAINAVELNDLQRELIEIDENLYRSALSPAEESRAIARRKAIYEQMHPETKPVTERGGPGRGNKNDRQNGHGFNRFSKDTAQKTGMSERTVQRNAERGRKIGEENLRKIAGSSLDSPGELDALARLDSETRDKLCAQAAAGDNVSAKAALAPKQERRPESQPKPTAKIKAAEKTEPEHEADDIETSADKRKAEYAEQDDLPGDNAAADNPVNDPLVIDVTRNDSYEEIEASPWFASKIKPIFEGKIKNDPAKSAKALAEFKISCRTWLPQMTPEDLEAAESILSVVGDLRYEVEREISNAKHAAAEAKRIKWEAKNPEKAKEKARERAQAEAMEDDMAEAKEANRGSGEPWSEQKDGWIEEWIANNWDAEKEAEFEAEFQEQWTRDHGSSENQSAKVAAKAAA